MYVIEQAKEQQGVFHTGVWCKTKKDVYWECTPVVFLHCLLTKKKKKRTCNNIQSKFCLELKHSELVKFCV